MRILLIFLLSFSSCSHLNRELKIDENRHLYISPRGPGLRPALLLVPDCFGLSDYFVERGHRFADLGFHVLAVDMNGKGLITLLPGESEKFCEGQEQPQLVLKKALKELKNLDGVDSQNISALGYEKGADHLFELARGGEEFRSLILVQGSLESIETKSSFSELKLLVLNASLDPGINSKRISGFKRELKLNQVTYDFQSFQGAKKGFYKPSSTKLGDDFDLPFAYDEEADKTSIKKIKEFLKKTLR
jgi:dienelactone hydrolase